MKKKNYSLSDLKVRSFVTGKDIKGGNGTVQPISQNCDPSFYTDCPTHLYCPSLDTNCTECIS